MRGYAHSIERGALDGFRSTFPEQELDLLRHNRTTSLNWVETSERRGSEDPRCYPQMQWYTIAKELHRERGESSVTKGQKPVPSRQHERLSVHESKLRRARI